mmetsp:Transcript_39130/g.102016  ORF Transcript_39130/g.102016 Transcript_39130/m.102016 type:complete len:255 (+) Transcript_39130:63-827(+)
MLPSGSVLRRAAAWHDQWAQPVGAADRCAIWAGRADHALGQLGPAYVVPGEPAVAPLARDGSAGRRHASPRLQAAEVVPPQQEAPAALGSAPEEPGGSLPAVGEDERGPDQDEDVPNLLTLGVHLQALQKEDPDSVFVVRGIHVLGFESPQMLMAHFSTFGEVANVLVSNSKVKPYRRRSARQWRIRPGGIGFVVMADAASVERVLQAGSQQIVGGKSVVLEPFKMIAAKSGSMSTVDVARDGGARSDSTGEEL